MPENSPSRPHKRRSHKKFFAFLRFSSLGGRAILQRWSNYNGNAIESDCTVTATRDSGGEVTAVSATRQVSYFAGAAQFEHDGNGGGVESYLHTNHLGTLTTMTNASAAAISHPAYTAFGELIPSSGGAGTRFGYAGALGYQAATWDSAYGECPNISSTPCDPLTALGWMHVGARYYDPSSGRFVQRDPIGISGGLNAYVYCGNNPIAAVDPTGLCPPSNSLWGSLMDGISKHFWLKYHSDAWLQSNKAVAEAWGISAAAGFGFVYAYGYLQALMRGTTGIMEIGYGEGSFVFRAKGTADWLVGTSGKIVPWFVEVSQSVSIPVRYVTVIGTGAAQSNCFWTALRQLIKAF